MLITDTRRPGEGAGTLILYVGSGHFVGFNIWNFNIFGGFQKICFGYDESVDIFGGSSQNWTIFEIISTRFRTFS